MIQERLSGIATHFHNRKSRRRKGEKMNETKKTMNKKTLLGVAALVVVIGLMAVAYAVFGPKAVAGSKEITIEVIDNTGKSTVYETKTDAEFLREAMEETKGLEVTGTESEYGLTIITVNGVTADFNVDSAYWSIMVNGEYGMYGADSQPVMDGDAFQLLYTVYAE
jgi:hypothetical protein